MRIKMPDASKTPYGEQPKGSKGVKKGAIYMKMDGKYIDERCRFARGYLMEQDIARAAAKEIYNTIKRRIYDYMISPSGGSGISNSELKSMVMDEIKRLLAQKYMVNNVSPPVIPARLISKGDMSWGESKGYRYERPGGKESPEKVAAQAMMDAKEQIDKLREILERIQKEPLLMQRVDRVTEDGKFAFVKKMSQDIRIEACPDLKRGDEVLLHPKSMQIVEHIGRPPLKASRFLPSKFPDITWDDIGGLEEAKRDMIEAIEMPHKHKEMFKRYKKRPIKGILLSGPPGCGKTMLGKAAANALCSIYGKTAKKSGFMYIKGPEILDRFVGATEEIIRDIFDDAKRHKEENGYPAIVFIDEADAVLAARGTRSVGIGNTIVPAFLTEMDGLDDSAAIVILASNRPDVLDPAVIRDGRIDRKIEIGRPCKNNASIILEAALKGVPMKRGLSKKEYAHGIADIIYRDNVFVRNGILMRDIISGAMLVGIIDLAVSHAIDREINGLKPKGLSEEDAEYAVSRQICSNIEQQNHLQGVA